MLFKDPTGCRQQADRPQRATPEVQRLGRHPQLSLGVARPLLLRSVTVELYPILIRIPEVQRLTHPMVAGAIERHAGVEHPSQRHGQIAPRRVADSQVIEPGAAAGWGEPSALSQVFRPM